MDPMLQNVYSMTKEHIGEISRHLMLGGGTRGGPILSRGKGVRVWDTDGKSYIDCTSQSWALYLGYCNEELWDVVNEHAHNLTHVHQGFDTLPRFALAKKLSDILPESLNRISFVPTSALALEGAMKLAIKNRPDSEYFMSLWDGYHGTTLGTMGSSWISTKSNGSYIGGSRFLPLTKNFIRVPNPYCYRCYFDQKPKNCNLMCAKMFELAVKKGVNGKPAGFLVEPVQASGGQIICPPKYIKRISEICKDHEIPLIFDEIQTFARIGKMTAAEYFGVTPDMIGFGKAIGGGLPLGVTAIRGGLEGFSPDTEELHTFANASLSHIAALKQLEIIERDNLLENTNSMGKYIKKGLMELQKEYPEMGDIRQVGLHIGVEFVKDPESKEPLYDDTVKIRNEGIKRGLILGLAGVMKNLLKIKPPLIITQGEADEVLDLLRQSLKVVLRA